MSRTLLIAATALFAACGGQAPKTEFKGRIIPLTDTILSAGGTDTVRFGRMHSGEIAVMRIWLENTAARPAVISSYERSCGCTTLEFDSQPIMPSQAQQIVLSFDSRGETGWQLKVVDIALAGASAPLRLLVEAEVE